jgi:hypothetical protein
MSRDTHYITCGQCTQNRGHYSLGLRFEDSLCEFSSLGTSYKDNIKIDVKGERVWNGFIWHGIEAGDRLL